jgi:hypothetical protein
MTFDELWENQGVRKGIEGLQPRKAPPPPDAAKAGRTGHSDAHTMPPLFHYFVRLMTLTIMQLMPTLEMDNALCPP